MINAKKLYYRLLNDERLTSIVEDIMDAYPDTVETFPCVIYLEENQNDIEFADNLPIADNLSMQVHIFTKALDGYATTSEIGLVVAEIMKENYFVCKGNTEVADVVDNVRHRVMTFGKFVLP